MWFRCSVHCSAPEYLLLAWCDIHIYSELNCTHVPATCTPHTLSSLPAPPDRPRLIQWHIRQRNRWARMMKGMEIEVTMSYCIINEHKLHCQSIYNFTWQWALQLCPFNYCIQRIFSIKISHCGQTAHLEAPLLHGIQNQTVKDSIIAEYRTELGAECLKPRGLLKNWMFKHWRI